MNTFERCPGSNSAIESVRDKQKLSTCPHCDQKVGVIHGQGSDRGRGWRSEHDRTLPEHRAEVGVVYVATCATRYEIMGVGATRAEAIKVTAERALAWIKQQSGSLWPEYPEHETEESIIEYFGIDGTVEKISVGTAVVIGQGEQE